jgi:hypothetical protein
MRSAIRAATVFTIGVGFLAASTAVADQRARAGKGGGITLHEASLQPSQGLQKMDMPDGTALYVSPRPLWNAMDVVSASAEPTSGGTTMELRLSGDASRRLTTIQSRGADARVALFDGGALISAGTITPEGRIRVAGITVDSAERIGRVVKGEVTPVAGPLLTVVPAGENNGRYLVDVYVQGVSDLRSYQITLVAGGGDSGRLELEAVNSDKARKDYVFGSAHAIDASSPTTGRLVASLYDGSVNTTTPLYLGTYSFRPSPDAQGTFRINIDLGNDTILANLRNEEMGYSAGADARIVVGPQAKNSK